LASGVLLSADGRLTQGLNSAGLAAPGDAQHDLAQILAGTGLRAEQQGGMFVLKPMELASAAPAAPAAAPAIVAQLPAIVLRDPAPLDAVPSRLAAATGATLRELPQSVTVVGSGQIREQGLSSMAELVEHVAGVQASQGEGNRDNVVFRGYNSSGDFFLDGARDDVQYFRDFYNIDSVEVLKGPNAMALGRGGSGGVINRVAKQAQWRDIANARLTLGDWEQRRASVDVGGAIDATLAWRLNAVDEKAHSFRDGVWSGRRGVSPALAWRDGATTLVTLSGEHFKDRRSTDRGIPSLDGRPVVTDPTTFFGSANLSSNWVGIDGAALTWEHATAAGVTLNSQLHVANYDKYYQNIFAGAVDGATATVRMLGYSSATRRRNVFWQSGATLNVADGSWTHRLAANLELGRQRSATARTTAYFDSLGADVRYVTVPLSDPTVTLPASFRPSATDADNGGVADTAAITVQDRLIVSPHWQVVAGLRHEVFRIAFDDYRQQLALRTTDRPWSPRLGVVFLPTPAWSLYLNYSQAYAVRAGEQLASLTTDTAGLRPERVRNLEFGARWTPSPELAATLAVYDLQRSNVLIADPEMVGVTHLADGQRGNGVELELDARLAAGWTVKSAYAWQRAKLTATQSATAQAGASMPHVPRSTLSVWSRYQFTPTLGAALGLVARSSMFTSTSNLVRLPGYGRLDGAFYYRWSPAYAMQANVENLLDRSYYRSSFSDNNISPGSPRAVRVSLDVVF
jgi:catecholate siderophore receptor